MLEEQTFMIANGCNLSCSYCWYETGSADYVKESLTPSVYADWLDRCIGYGINLKQINLTGGEPLLRGDFSELLAVTSSRAANVSVFTNGLLLKEKMLETLRSAGCEVHVSIDHVSPDMGDRVRGGTKAAITGIAALADVGIRDVQICMVVTSLNYNDVGAVAQFASKFDYKVEFIPVALPSHHPLGLMSLSKEERGVLGSQLLSVPGVDSRPTYYSRFRRYLQTGSVGPSAHCRAAERGIYVDADGEISLCTQRTQPSLGTICSSDPAFVLENKERAVRGKRPGSCVSLDCLVLV